MPTATTNPPAELPERAELINDGRSLRLELTIEDPDVLADVERGGLGSDPVAAAKAYYRVGLIVSSTSRLDATIGEARRMEAGLRKLAELPNTAAERLSDQIRQEIRRIVGAGEEPGLLEAAIDASLKRGSEDLAKTLKPVVDQLAGAGPDAMPQLLEARLRRAIDEASKELLGRVFATDGSSPLMLHLEASSGSVKQLEGRLAELEQRLGEQSERILRELITQDAAIDPAAAGRDWESTVLEAISRLSAVTGDRLEITGDVPGHSRSKKGDGVLHVAPEGGLKGLRVVVECRTGIKRVTVPALISAIENREAHAAILLTESATGLPRDAETLGFRIYFDDRIVVVHYDPSDPSAASMLAAALQVARTMARSAGSAPDRVHDHQAISAAIAQIQTAIGQLKPMRACATGITGEVGRIRDHADRIQQQLQTALADLTVLTQAA